MHMAQPMCTAASAIPARAGMQPSALDNLLIVAVSTVQPRVRKPLGPHPQVRPAHLPPVLSGARQGHRLHQGARSVRRAVVCAHSYTFAAYAWLRPEGRSIGQVFLSCACWRGLSQLTKLCTADSSGR